MVQLPWQDALNPQLTQRLLRPLVCPGVIPDTLAVAIFERSRQFKQRLSLLHQFQQRWGQPSTLQVPDVPIVYAQWAGSADSTPSPVVPVDSDHHRTNPPVRGEQTQTTLIQNVSPPPVSMPTASVSTSPPLVIQAKFVNSSGSIPATESPLPMAPGLVSQSSQNAQDHNPLKPSLGGDTATLAPAPLPVVTPSPSRMAIAPATLSPIALSSTASEALEGQDNAHPERGIVQDRPASAMASPPLPIVTPSPFSMAIAPVTLPPIALGSTASESLESRDNDHSKRAIVQDRATSTSAPAPLPVVTPSPSRTEISLEKRSQSRATPSIPAPLPIDAASSFAPLKNLPLVNAERVADPLSSQQTPNLTQPLVLARPASSHVSSPNQESAIVPSASGHPVSERSPVVSAQPADQQPLTSAASPTPPSAIDVRRLTQQVERKLMRKLTVERERRGHQTWH